MKDASRISTARHAASCSNKPAAGAVPVWLESPRLPKVRRKAEARRWLDLLSVFTSNGLPRDRWPGQRLLMPRESLAIRRVALARLERRDPELFMAVHAVIAERMDAARGLTIDQLNARGKKWFARVSRLRRAIRAAKLEALGR